MLAMTKKMPVVNENVTAVPLVERLKIDWPLRMAPKAAWLSTFLQD